MLAPRVLLAAVLIGIPEAADAQDITALIQAGRFEEAAAAAPSDQRGEVARAIFRQAYQFGHQDQEFAYAIRGYVAAKPLVPMGDPMYEQLSFWHGFALYSAGVDAQAAQTVASAQTALPMFEDALDLFAEAGAYPTSVNVNMTQLVAAANTYIEIQRAVIDRGR